jgi:hypothetical protein
MKESFDRKDVSSEKKFWPKKVLYIPHTSLHSHFSELLVGGYSHYKSNIEHVHSYGFHSPCIVSMLSVSLIPLAHR